VVALASNAFVARFLAAEHTARYWDQLSYWSRYRELAALFARHPGEALREVVRSVRVDEYNLLPVLAPAAVARWTGTGWSAFVETVHNLFVLPSVLALGAWAASVLRMEQEPAGETQLTASGRSTSTTPSLWDRCTLAAGPPLYLASVSLVWVPALWGYPDVGGCLLAAAALALWLRRPALPASRAGAAAVGCLLAVLASFRRWYLLWSAAAIVVALFEAFRLRPRPARRGQLLSWLVMAATTGIAYTLLSFEHLRRAASTDYRDAYSAYRTGPYLIGNLRLLGSELGPLHLALALVGALVLLRSPVLLARRAAAFVTLQAVLVLLAFSLIQDLAHTHYALFFPALALLGAAGWLLPWWRSPWRWAWRLGVAGLLLGNLAAVFVPAATTPSRPWRWLFAADRVHPDVRTDLPQLARLLDVLAARTGGDDRIYVLASSPVLNSEILGRADLSFGYSSPASARVLPAHEVDRRDGFPFAALDARLVVIAEPIQYHLAPEDQRVVGVLAGEIASGHGIGAYYRRLPDEIHLQPDVTVRLFERQAPPPRSAVDTLLRRFHGWYPHHDRLFPVPPAATIAN